MAIIAILLTRRWKTHLLNRKDELLWLLLTSIGAGYLTVFTLPLMPVYRLEGANHFTATLPVFAMELKTI